MDYEGPDQGKGEGEPGGEESKGRYSYEGSMARSRNIRAQIQRGIEGMSNHEKPNGKSNGKPEATLQELTKAELGKTQGKSSLRKPIDGLSHETEGQYSLERPRAKSAWSQPMTISGEHHG
jgi:hypothetical protein